MRRLGPFNTFVALLALWLGADLHNSTVGNASVPSPTSFSMPVIEERDGTLTQFSDSVYGWSVSWSTDFWVSDPMPLPYLLWLESQASAGNGPSDEIAIVRLYVLEHIDGGYVDFSGYNFTDTKECLNFEDGLLGGQLWPTPIEVMEGPNGQLLINSTPDRTWAITQRLDDDDKSIEYIECRILETGSSYLMIAAWAPDKEAFASLIPELEVILESITYPGLEATPSVTD